MKDQKLQSRTLWFGESDQTNGLPDVNDAALEQGLLEVVAEAFSKDVEFIKTAAYKKKVDTRSPALGQRY